MTPVSICGARRYTRRDGDPGAQPRQLISLHITLPRATLDTATLDRATLDRATLDSAVNPHGTIDESTFGFELLEQRGQARRGRISTPHGAVETPAFVAVGTQATVKGLSAPTISETGTQLLFANTYHLFLRPGEEVVSTHGGLHRFMGWDAPLMTDSGGFQVFSLGAGIEHGVGKVSSIFPGEETREEAKTGEGRRGGPSKSMVEVDEAGVRFRSHIDGSPRFLSPEISIAVQRALGADMILAFDECTSPLHDRSYTEESMERTHRWAQRSLAAFRENPAVHPYRQALYGIVQGGAYSELRQRSASFIGGMEFDAFAIGGNLGRTHDEMYSVIDWTIPYLPAERPRHLLGIGDVPAIFEAVERGCDTFDCVSPTRNSRNASLLVRFDEGRAVPNFRLNVRNARFARDMGPIEEGCDCLACRTVSRSYLRHLFKAGESLGPQLATIHNLRFMTRLFADIRRTLDEGSFTELKAEWLAPEREET
ncbi:MAG: tRNA guanosine(34) transglycosylase Tgt [Trueperaceae bacterium]